jgi:acetyl esterase/lipase
MAGRRSLLAAAALLAASRANAQNALQNAPQNAPQTVPQEIPLWPGPPPGGGSGPRGPERVGAHGQVTDIRTPRLLLHRPSRPNGMAVLVISGGGYRTIELGSESGPAAAWLQSQGVTAFELVYRLPRDWTPVSMLADGQRAMRLVRSLAGSLGYATDRIGVIGFSAGGHLAGMTTVEPAAALVPATDAVDALSARPDFAGLIYPVLTMLPPWNTTQAFRQILGPDASPAACAAWSVERHVGPDCPPVFLAQAADDPISPIANSLLMFAALQAAGQLPEMHIFRTGGHGWGMGKPGTEEVAWPGLFAAWVGLR